MTTSTAVQVDSSATWRRGRYWLVTGLFCSMFVFSALLTLFDPEGTRRQTEELGYPVYIAMYPLALAKIAGVVAILARWSPTLTTFAFAGFFFDLVLAGAAHVYERDFPYGWLAVFGLVLWCAAFWVERDRTAAESAA